MLAICTVTWLYKETIGTYSSDSKCHYMVCSIYIYISPATESKNLAWTTSEPQHHVDENGPGIEQSKQNDTDNDENKVEIEDTLMATNGNKVAAENVFIAAFQHLQTEANKFLKKKKIRGINNNEIQWIITVPAIWNDTAKSKMEQWAIKAGLVDENIPNQCKIVYEPDCASLASNITSNRINSGIRYNNKT